MGKLRRYCTALTRYRKSKGFGIHSPFAFNFVLNVLREKAAYYAYADIRERRNRARHTKQLLRLRKPKMISEKSARMMFRVANHFNPSAILQLGTNYGVSAYSSLRVSSRSRMWLADCSSGPAAALVLLQDLIERIDVSKTCIEAIRAYESEAPQDGGRYVVVNRIPADEAEAVGRWLQSLAEGDGVVVMRNLQHDEVVSRLWRSLLESLDHGMTFTNGKMGIAVLDRKLPRQNFQLWF